MTALPTISIVIPSYNQAHYLEETLLSIIDQDYPALDLVIIDGGSTDRSVEVIEKYQDRIAHWVSEKDDGQADAINKGLKQIQGDVWAYVNSDDLLEPGCLQTVGEYFRDHPEHDWLSGGCRVFGEDSETWYLDPGGLESKRTLITPWNRTIHFVFPQSGACFLHRRVIDKIGCFDPTYHYSMDIEYYTRAILVGEFEQHIIDQRLAAWRWHEEAKSFQKGLAFAFREDEVRIAEAYLSYLTPQERAEVRKELRFQKREVSIRKALWQHNQGLRMSAIRSLLDAAVRSPSSLWYRYWLGTMKTALFR